VIAYLPGSVKSLDGTNELSFGVLIFQMEKGETESGCEHWQITYSSFEADKSGRQIISSGAAQ